MDIFFLFLFLISFFGIILGTIKPKLIRFPSRKKVLIYGIPATIVFMFLLAFSIDGESIQAMEIEKANSLSIELEETITNKDIEIKELKATNQEMQELLNENDSKLTELTSRDEKEIEEELEDKISKVKEDLEKELRIEIEKDLKTNLEEDYVLQINDLNEEIKDKETTIEKNAETVMELKTEVDSLHKDLDAAKTASTTENNASESPDNSQPSSSCGPGTVKINSASETELQSIYEIGAERASQIINLRPFSSYSDMKRIKGIADARATAIENQGIVCFD